MTGLSRRSFLGAGAGAIASGAIGVAQGVAEETDRHGMSAFGDLKYPPDFSNFDYVDPRAPKGGTFSLIPSSRAYNQSDKTFNSLNAFVLKGEGAQGMDLTFVSLMAHAGDEPDAMYGFAARSVQISPDKLVYRYTIRPEARFHDGSKLTSESPRMIACCKLLGRVRSANRFPISSAAAPAKRGAYH